MPIGEVSMILIAPSLPCAVRTQISQPAPEWSQIPFILPEHGPARKRIDNWFRHHKLTNPLIYATVSGHEAIVSMVALGCGVALIPGVVLENSPEPIRNRISVMDNMTMDAPLPLGVCVQKNRLDEPLIAAFWQLLR